MKRRMAAVLAPAMLLIGGVSAGCGYARMDRSWKSPEFHGPAFRKVSVVVVAADSDFRQACEDAFLRRLQAMGIMGMPGPTLAGESQTADEAAMAEAVAKAGADAVLLARWAKVERRALEIQPEPGVWVKIQSAWPGTYKPVIGGYVNVVTLDIRLLGAADMQRVWSGTIRTFDAQDLKRAASGVARTITMELARQKLI